MVRRKAAVAGQRKVGQRRKEKRKLRTDWGRKIPAPANLIAKPVIPKSKHHSYFEFAENTDKKKKIEFLVTDKKKPTAGFTFVPIGNPELTHACKELSREDGALMYIVSTRKETHAQLGEHVHRVGYHFRSGIVEKAIDSLGKTTVNGSGGAADHHLGSPDRIPETQEDINKQADAAIRDLFPRIPNTDREMIIQHAFQKGAVFNGKPVVGLQEDLSLSRRVQLAVIAHIRHTHTRYDLLLRETSWENARKAVESLCLDILVKWRGDEETGRDQLDEVLREIVVISDTEEEDGSGETDSENDEDADVEDEDDEDEEDEDDDDDDNDENSSDSEILELTSAESHTSRAIGHRVLPNYEEPRVRNEGLSHSHALLEPVSVGLPPIASRTRSRTKRGGDQGRKARKDKKRFQRFERYAQAVSRRQEVNHPQTTHNSVVQQPNIPMDSIAPFSSSTHIRHTLRQQNQEPQYFIDENQPPKRTIVHSQPGYPLKPDLAPREEQVLLGSRSDGLSDKQRGFYSASPGNPTRTEFYPVSARHLNGQHRLENHLSRQFQERSSQDLVIPSIETMPDSDRAMPGSYRARHNELKYIQVGFHSGRGLEAARPQPMRPEVIYIDDTPPRHRRIMTGNDQNHYNGMRDERKHPLPRLRYEGLSLSASSQGQFWAVGSEKTRYADQEHRYHGDSEALQQRPRFTVPDRSTQRRADTSPSLKGLSLEEAIQPEDRHYNGDLHNHKRQRFDQENLATTSKPMAATQGASAKHLVPIDTRQPGRDFVYNGVAKSHQKRLAADSLYPMSSFHYPHSSQEMSSGSYPVNENSSYLVPISHTQLDPDARSMSARTGGHGTHIPQSKSEPQFAPKHADRITYQPVERREPAPYAVDTRDQHVRWPLDEGLVYPASYRRQYLEPSRGLPDPNQVIILD